MITFPHFLDPPPPHVTFDVITPTFPPPPCLIINIKCYQSDNMITFGGFGQISNDAYLAFSMEKGVWLMLQFVTYCDHMVGPKVMSLKGRLM